MSENEIGELLLGAAMKVHSVLGSGLLESAYEACLVHEIRKQGVELKSIDKILPIHVAQLMSYLKLSGLKLGYLLNFNVVHMRDGIKRLVNGL